MSTWTGIDGNTYTQSPTGAISKVGGSQPYTPTPVYSGAVVNYTGQGGIAPGDTNPSGGNVSSPIYGTSVTYGGVTTPIAQGSQVTNIPGGYTVSGQPANQITAQPQAQPQVAPIQPNVVQEEVKKVDKPLDTQKVDVMTGDTLDKVQASPIPEFPSEFGVGSGVDRGTWAVKHREGIYNAYLDILKRQPTSAEVNQWLVTDSNIGSIRQQMTTSSEAKRLNEVKPIDQKQKSVLQEEVDKIKPKDPVTDLLDKMQQYKKNIREDEGLNVLEKKSNELKNQLDIIQERITRGVYGEEQRTIAMPFITGRQRAIKEAGAIDYNALATQYNTLQNQIARADKNVEGTMDIIEKLLTNEYTTEQDRQNALKTPLGIDALQYGLKPSDTMNDIISGKVTPIIPKADLKVSYETANGQNWMVSYDPKDPIGTMKKVSLGSAYKTGGGGNSAGNAGFIGGSTLSNAFYNAIDSGKDELQQGEPWGNVWRRIKSQFPNVPDSTIDELLGVEWREEGAYQKWAGGKKVESTDSWKSWD